MMIHEHSFSYPLYLYYSNIKYLYVVIMDVKQNTKETATYIEVEYETCGQLSEANRTAGVLLLSFQTQVSPYAI